MFFALATVRRCRAPVSSVIKRRALRWCSTKIETHTDTKILAEETKDGALVVSDLDGVVCKSAVDDEVCTIGTEPWFLFRIARFAASGLGEAEALSETLILYNRIQNHICSFIPPVPGEHLGNLYQSLREERGATVIAHTSRNHEAAKRTVSNLHGMGARFCEHMLKEQSFFIDGKMILVLAGITFTSGGNKGQILKFLFEKGILQKAACEFSEIIFIDDTRRHCETVAVISEYLGVPMRIIHYEPCPHQHRLSEEEVQIVLWQEEHFLATNSLLCDDEARARYLS